MPLLPTLILGKVYAESPLRETRMNQRFASILLFAFVVAAAASFLLYRLLGSRAPAAGPPASRVMLATHNLDPGTLIKESDLSSGDWSGTVPPGAIRRKED